MENSGIKLNQLFDADVDENRMRILIVDDEETILRSLSYSLTELDNTYKVETASSAEEALEIMREQPVDLVISDLRLPEMDGLKLTENVHRSNPETSSILITAFGNDEISKSAERQGTLYLEKPFNIDDLIDQINLAFSQRGRFRVSLPEVTLTDVVRLYQHSNGSAVLSIVAENTAGMMVIEGGRITHVRLNDLEGPVALLQILDLRSGSINALSCAAPQRETLSVSADRLEAAIRSQHRAERLRLIQGSFAEDNLEDDDDDSAVWLADGVVEEIDYEDELEDWEEDELEDLDEDEIEDQDESEEEVIVEEEIEVQAADIEVEAVKDKGLPLRVKKGEVSEKRTPTKTPILSLEPKEEALAPLPLTALERKKERIKVLIHEGVEHFKAQRLDEAKQTWLRALKLDPYCREAKRNIAILEQVISSLNSSE